MHSCIYSGRIRHRRYVPARHEFSYPLYMMYLDLAELPALFERFWCWSARRPALARFKREDYLGDAATPLDRAIRDTVQNATGIRPHGSIRLLTHLRYFGYVFNPVTFYYCFDATDSRVETIVAEITNTPWNQRHAYVLPTEGAARGNRTMRFDFDKTFHVSPFMPMGVRYDWRFSPPDAGLLVHMRNVCERQRLFDATLALRRIDITHASMARILMQFPLMTAKVTGAIYWQALRLLLKRTPFFTHPDKRAARRPAIQERV